MTDHDESGVRGRDDEPTDSAPLTDGELEGVRRAVAHQMADQRFDDPRYFGVKRTGEIVLAGEAATGLLAAVDYWTNACSSMHSERDADRARIAELTEKWNEQHDAARRLRDERDALRDDLAEADGLLALADEHDAGNGSAQRIDDLESELAEAVRLLRLLQRWAPANCGMLPNGEPIAENLHAFLAKHKKNDNDNL